MNLSNDLGFDVVPCFSIKPHSAFEQQYYLIPDGNNGWIHTNPRLDQDFSDKLHANNYRTLRRGVKLFKWWNNQNIGGRIASYFAELAIMQAFENLNRQGRYIDAVSLAAAIAFNAVYDACQTGSLQSPLKSAPTVEPGDVTRGDLRELNVAARRADVAVRQESAGDQGSAIKTWGTVFGEKFPKE